MVASQIDSVENNETLVKRFSGPYGWIDVTRDRKNGLHIRQNIHYGLGDSRSSAMELLQGHLPLLLHPIPPPGRLYWLGHRHHSQRGPGPPIDRRHHRHGAGPPGRASRPLFRQGKRRYLGQPTGQRLHRRRSPPAGSKPPKQNTPTYDVVVSDLFVPWESKTGYLYTAEHYQAVKTRLADNGVFCQWLAGWQVGPLEFDVIAQTMKSVFNHVAIWQVSRKSSRPPLRPGRGKRPNAPVTTDPRGPDEAPASSGLWAVSHLEKCRRCCRLVRRRLAARPPQLNATQTSIRLSNLPPQSPTGPGARG